jgi:hypothetical protein
LATLLAALGISAGWLGLASYLGAGLAWLLAPQALRGRLGWLLLAPPLGYCLAAALGFYATNAGANLVGALWAALALGTLLNLLALGLALRGRRFGAEAWPPRPAWGVAAALLGATALVWWLALWPALSYGRLMPIGHNWDVEFYLPLARYLRERSYLTLGAAPPNPLLPVVTALPTSARAIGFAYVQGMADALRGGDSFESFAPLLALMQALAVPMFYLLARVGLGIGPLGALAGALLAGANSLLLWISYNSFAMQVSATPLLPLALLLALLALRDADWRAALGGGLALAGMTLSYYPMLLPYAALALPLGLLALLERWRAEGLRGATGVLGRAAALLALGVGLSLLAHLRAREAFLGVFEQQTASMGIDSFVALSAALGVAPFSHRALPDATPPWAEALGLGCLALLLGLAFARPSWRRGYGAGLLVAFALYALWLRFGVAFPYGYLKGMSYAGFVPLLLAGGALAGTRGAGSASRTLSALSYLSYLSYLSLALITAMASYGTAQVYVGRPGIYSLDDALARELLAALDAPGPVLISHSTALRGPYVGLLGYTLAERALLGKNDAGFGRLDHLPPGLAPTYGIFAAGEDPAAWGFDPQAVVWQSERAVALRAPAGRLAHLQGRLGAYDEPTLGAGGDDGSLAVTRLGTGDYRAATAENPLRLYLGASSLAFEEQPAGAPDAPQSVLLALVSFAPQEVVLRSERAETRYRVEPGLSYISSEPLAGERELSIAPSGPAPLYLRWAELHAAPLPERVWRDEATLVYRVEADAPGGALRASFANGSGQALRAGLEFYQNSRAAPAHPASGLFSVPDAETVELTVDLAARTATINGAELPVQQLGAAPNGSYFAGMWIYQGEEARSALPLLSYRWAGGQVDQVAALTPGLGFARVRPLAQALDARLGEQIRLRGFELDRASYAPGTSARLSLLWSADAGALPPSLVFAQALDDAENKAAQWDGNAGGDWHPTPLWRVGESVRQDIPLEIAPGTPPGRYRLIVGLYDPATGQRLPVQRDGQPAGDFVTLGELVVE